MEVIVAEKCGFCHGVKNAISTAEKILTQEDEVYSLGPIIHNKDVVERLAKAGLKTVNDVEEVQSGTVLIRSHGAAPVQMARLKEKGVNIVDATCILVKRVQHIAGEFEKDGYKVVIIGDENHPEVQAVVGFTKDAVVIADESDLHKLPENAKLGIVCQTTESPDHFGRMLGAIGGGRFREMKVINTLCVEAIKRQQSAVELCKEVDIMFVLGGLESANTRRLADLCKEENSETYHLQNWNGLDKRTLFGKKIAGVTAGASTPEWIIAEFVENLEAFEES
ncbi:MAG: 4-hydroxy-3-methylbut-2-enyl diphosphate reductase [Phycisphaerae bacterium]|nr:4-hydroxy-3-methylbut-2-enyl diphosphate reductase [Phycisphaerae bacterium]NIP52160.1 4-hydroxy-3-methylbut-2-enyl diphosphate reductase [Phycisphaerae bacterium]NIS51165.1 4-hydroxy-3-methylbut-2-enyl diphosphate reductase [Phycisphaerae bacterium]NIU08835.1 4-hydroxy-3-methylbut-2-enyl diphosphate reductase [Phycisphaerae bacterium]NIU59790.1 4-hydroxy-3-methylbut-2-enyl diphosphate reductase [Phycisphaerae bacterium]